jgi:hypothetical protein
MGIGDYMPGGGYPVTSKYIQKALDSIASATYTPSPAHIRAKDAFWEEVGMDTPPEAAERFLDQLRASNARLDRWASSIPGFTEWFLEAQYEQLQARATSQLAMNELTALLLDTESQPAVKIAAAKVAREYYDRLVPKPVDKMADQEIAEMSPEQLRDFITRNSQKLLPKN